MGQKPDTISNNFTAGEISPTSLGRFDISKYANAAETIENWLVSQVGGVFVRPGTRYVATTKTVANRSRLLKFQYSTTQSYVIEAGNLYFRYYANGGQVVSGVTPVELVTVFTLANLRKIRYTQNADTMYIATGTYKVQKHQRTSATAFTIADAAFVRGPFLDTNITSTTITPSSATGTTVLTASSAIFQSGHVGSLWRVKDGVVKITIFTDTTHVTGIVQSEPDGTAGALGTTSAVTDWAEGSWSGVRGYPKVCCFHEGRLYFANTDYQVGGIWGSQPFAPENFKAQDGNDDSAINVELGADEVSAVRWLVSTSKGLLAGTTAGIFPVGSGSQNLPVTPDNVGAPLATSEGTADLQARKLGNSVYYPSNDLQKFLEAGYQFDVDQIDAEDATILADHILNAPEPTNIPARSDHELGGAYDLDAQQSPNKRMWVVRDDGQIAVLTRNIRQEVNGWIRITGGETVACDGKSGIGIFESIVIVKQEGAQDVIWVQCNRLINGSVQRFIEYFTAERFKYEWDPVRLDASLTLDDPLDITAITLANPIVITSAAHGLINGDRVKLDNIVGTYQLNGNEYLVGNVTTNTFALFETE